MSAVRVGIIGAGAIAQVAHLPALARMPHVDLAAICDSDFAKARAVASRFDVPSVYDDIEELLRHAQPDLVAVCTPNHLHEIHVLIALRAGAHVLCERPLALSSTGVEKIQAAARQTQRAVMVGMNHRFRTDVQAVRTFLKSGELGPVTGVRCGWYMFRATGPTSGWRQRRVQAGGGAMLDLGISLVDLALWLTGCPMPRYVSAILSREDPAADVEEAGCALVACDAGLSIFVDVARRYVGDTERFWLDVTCARGTAGINPLKVFKDVHGIPISVAPSGASGRENPFTASYRAEWARCLAIAQGAVERSDLEDQVLLHRVLEAIYRSAGEGRGVTL